MPVPASTNWNPRYIRIYKRFQLFTNVLCNSRWHTVLKRATFTVVDKFKVNTNILHQVLYLIVLLLILHLIPFKNILCHNGWYEIKKYVLLFTKDETTIALPSMRVIPEGTTKYIAMRGHKNLRSRRLRHFDSGFAFRIRSALARKLRRLTVAISISANFPNLSASQKGHVKTVLVSILRYWGSGAPHPTPFWGFAVPLYIKSVFFLFFAFLGRWCHQIWFGVGNGSGYTGSCAASFTAKSSIKRASASSYESSVQLSSASVGVTE